MINFLIVAKSGYWSNKFSAKLLRKGYQVSLLMLDIDIVCNHNIEHNHDIDKTIVIIPIYGHDGDEFRLIKTISRKGFKVIALANSKYPETSVKSYLHGAWKCVEKSSDINVLIEAISYVNGHFL